MKVVAGLLVVVMAALGWALYTLNQTRREMAAQQQTNEVVILDFSNRWATARQTLDEQKKVNETLETNLFEGTKQLETLRVEIANLSTDLAKSRAETKTAQAETKNAQAEVARRDQQINSLETKNVDLTKKMGDLQTDIAALERQITEAERKISTTEGNRQELLKELQRMQDEKVGLEKQLNDLAFVREQVRKLREELTVARRLDWIRRGLYGATPKKGAEILSGSTRVTPTESPKPPATPANPALEVELKRSGEITIGSPTNAPKANR